MPRFDMDALLGGSDQEFLVRLYGALLNRWPDEEGWRFYMARIAGRPDQRRGVVQEIASCDEARRLGVSLLPESHAPSGAWLSRLAAEADALAQDIARLRLSAALLLGPHARAAVAARLQPLEQRLARLEQAAAE